MDKPIAHTEDGRPIFDNTATVVAGVVITPEKKILAVRRANNPGAGLLGLPGGYHMRGESWQEAGAREVKEETGHSVSDVYSCATLVTDEYGNNMQFGVTYSLGVGQEPLDGEALEVLELSEVGDLNDWAFPRHYEIAQRCLSWALPKLE